MARPTRAAILAGGRAARLGGRRKHALEIGGRTVLDRIADAVLEYDPAADLCVAGPELPEIAERRPGLRWVREEPPFAGPAAGVAAAMAALEPDEDAVVLLLAGDLPLITAAACAALCAAAGAGAPALAADASGRDQYLCAAWPEPVLRERLDGLGDATGLPVRRLYAGSPEPTRVGLPEEVLADIDAPADLDRVRALIEGRGRPGRPRAARD
ncbi:molybdenum cofactor guanylyltransferase [Gulosibacter sp. 10]|uniref:molybdenum cofactor guanylyltransferase n=1 Tax=Gulosibacter sp. 10 TaxID=1255570 RepID=UPI00097F17FC|nr:NTP transferase domain-containing protein [Gulosibacter sp. 10]SJM56717.1 Molybdopterin-guanine dinucleotide biosynthesis protein MobA [Gulosibacter sp. 10]